MRTPPASPQARSARLFPIPALRTTDALPERTAVPGALLPEAEQRWRRRAVRWVACSGLLGALVLSHLPTGTTTVVQASRYEPGARRHRPTMVQQLQWPPPREPTELAEQRRSGVPFRAVTVRESRSRLETTWHWPGILGNALVGALLGLSALALGRRRHGAA